MAVNVFILFQYKLLTFVSGIKSAAARFGRRKLILELVSAATSVAAAVVVEEEAVSAASKLSLASAVEVPLPLLFVM